jgi:hypothetical protein
LKGACGGLDSLKYSKLVAIGNPIRAEGRFVDLIRQADKDREDCIPPNKAVCAIRIPSTESPHAYLEKSPYGLADRTWLEACYRHYGSNSLWVGSHIDARIPELSADVLMSKAPFQARVGKAWDDRAGLPGFLRGIGGLSPVRRTELTRPLACSRLCLAARYSARLSASPRALSALRLCFLRSSFVTRHSPFGTMP